MKAPYRLELAALDATYRAARGADVGVLARAASELGAGPAVFVGTGGSMVLALLAARLHEQACRQPGKACTSLELLDLPQLQHRGAMLFSSSARHPDARRVLREFRRGRFSPAGVVTHRSADDIEPLSGPDARVVMLDEPAQRDGFLATGSILQPYGGKSRFTADGGIGQGGLRRADWEFETSMILAAWNKPDWPEGAGVYIAIWLTPDDGEHPELQVGAFNAPKHDVTQLVWTYASNVEEPGDQKARNPALARTDKAVLDRVWEGLKTEWVFASRDWKPTDGDADINWLLDGLEAAMIAWDPQRD